MSEKVVIVAGGSPKNWPDIELLKLEDIFWIGVDRGALFLLEYGIIPDIAVGDFDSINKNELKKVQDAVGTIHYSLPEKDNTDTQLALLLAIKEKPLAEYILLGATGGRMDHFLSNLWLPLEDRFRQYIAQIKLVDTQNTITYFLPGEHTIVKEPNKKYLAFICLTPVTGLSLYDVKYKLEKEDVSIPFSYASNEFIGQTATFSFGTGVLAVIQSKDK